MWNDLPSVAAFVPLEAVLLGGSRPALEPRRQGPTIARATIRRGETSGVGRVCVSLERFAQTKFAGMGLFSDEVR